MSHYSDKSWIRMAVFDSLALLGGPDEDKALRFLVDMLHRPCDYSENEIKYIDNCFLKYRSKI